MQRRRASGATPGLRRNALGQTNLFLRRRPVASGRQSILAPPRVATSWSKYTLDPLKFHACALYAGQVGVSLVRRLGFGFSLRAIGTDRPRVRQRATMALAL